MTPIGISSNCRPELSAAGLAELATRLGAEVVDLRAGRGQGWEAQGVGPLRDAGVPPVFVGISLALGRPDQPCRERLAELARLGAGALPVKVFVDEAVQHEPQARARARIQAHQLQEATGPGGLLLETHHGYAGLPALLELCAETGSRLLVDTLGAARIDVDLAAVATRLRPVVAACQVKGYAPADPADGRHRPLATMPPGHAATLRAVLPPGAPVLVESRAGCLAEDVAVLREWFDRPAIEGVDRASSDH